MSNFEITTFKNVVSQGFSLRNYMSRCKITDFATGSKHRF
jgi:hypothetical protein